MLNGEVIWQASDSSLSKELHGMLMDPPHSQQEVSVIQSFNCKRESESIHCISGAIFIVNFYHQLYFGLRYSFVLYHLQELFLAALYKIYNFGLAPIFFYVEAVFSLQGFFLCSLYLIAWKLSGTWLAGVLTSALVIVNRWVCNLGMHKYE